MKQSEIFREAAECIQDGRERLACCAVINACDTDEEADDAVGMFAGYFEPEEPALSWFGRFTPDNQAHRMTALCLMAAIAESEGN